MASFDDAVLNVSDDECMVVQFINVPIKQAFRVWLKNTDNNGIVGRVTEVWWPGNVEMKCASAIKRHLRSLTTADWKAWPVKVLAIGGYLEMCEQACNKEKYGFLDSTRAQRKYLRKKALSSDDSELELPSDAGSNFEPRKVEKENLKKRKSSPIQKHDTNKKVNITSNAVNSNVLSKIKNLSSIHLNSEDDFTEDEREKDLGEYNEKSSKSELLEKINMLNIEIARLKEENARLRTLKTLSSDFHVLTDMSTSLIKNFSDFENKIRSIATVETTYFFFSLALLVPCLNGVGVDEAPRLVEGISRMPTDRTCRTTPGAMIGE